MHEMIFSKAAYDLMRLRAGEYAFSIHAVWVGSRITKWPHLDVSLKALEKESQNYEATAREAWTKNEFERARKQLELLSSLYIEINKIRLSKNLQPIAYILDRGTKEHGIYEVYVDWEFMRTHRSKDGLQSEANPQRTKEVYKGQDSRLLLELNHAHVALHLMRPDLVEAWVAMPTLLVRTMVRHYLDDEVCRHCRGPLNYAGPLVLCIAECKAETSESSPPPLYEKN